MPTCLKAEPRERVARGYSGAVTAGAPWVTDPQVLFLVSPRFSVFSKCPTVRASLYFTFKTPLFLRAKTADDIRQKEEERRRHRK